MKKKLQAIEKIIEWLSTALVISASALLSFGFPKTAAVLFFTGAIFWIITGWLWKKNSIMVLNGFIAFVYIAGWIKLLFEAPQ